MSSCWTEDKWNNNNQKLIELQNDIDKQSNYINKLKSTIENNLITIWNLNSTILENNNLKESLHKEIDRINWLLKTSESNLEESKKNIVLLQSEYNSLELKLNKSQEQFSLLFETLAETQDKLSKANNLNNESNKKIKEVNYDKKILELKLSTANISNDKLTTELESKNNENKEIINNFLQKLVNDLNKIYWTEVL